MPILPLETSIFPEGLLEPSAIETNQGEWWVLHTRPRTEKNSRPATTHSFHPLLLAGLFQARTAAQPHDNFLSAAVPSYLFINGDDSIRRGALETNYVIRTIPVVDRERLMQDLSRVYRLMISGVPMAPEDRLQPGQWVQITSGPLQGMDGKLIRRGTQDQLIVEVNFLQRGASVEVEGWAIKPLDSVPYEAPAKSEY